VVAPSPAVVLLTTRTLLFAVRNTPSEAGEECRHSRAKRTSSEPSGRARSAVTRGKESWNSPWKHGSTCANVENMLVTGSPTARLTAQRGEIRALCGYCKPGSKCDSRHQIHYIQGSTALRPCIPRRTDQNSCTSWGEGLDSPWIPRPTCARVPVLIT
jgi:hypothetical protein